MPCCQFLRNTYCWVREKKPLVHSWTSNPIYFRLSSNVIIFGMLLWYSSLSSVQAKPPVTITRFCFECSWKSSQTSVRSFITVVGQHISYKMLWIQRRLNKQTNKQNMPSRSSSIRGDRCNKESVRMEKWISKVTWWKFQNQIIAPAFLSYGKWTSFLLSSYQIQYLALSRTLSHLVFSITVERKMKS